MLGCGLSDEGCVLCSLWVAVKAGKGHGGGCTSMNESNLRNVSECIRIRNELLK